MVVERKAERGAAVVEFALILVPLMMILLGTIDWGYYFFVEQLVNNASREGARSGSLVPGPGDEALAEAGAETAARAYLDASGLDSGRATVVASAGGAMVGPSVRVTVTYPTGSITGFEVLRSLLPASASATSEFRR